VLKQLHEQCMGIMQQVKLGYLVEREGGWGTAKHWSTTLSLGEQQRMGMGRLFFHRCVPCPCFSHAHSTFQDADRDTITRCIHRTY